MITTIRSKVLASVLGFGGLFGFSPTPALAQVVYRGGYGIPPGYVVSYGPRVSLGAGVAAPNVNLGYPPPAFYNGGASASEFYGVGANDLVPHWHTTRGPFGSYRWFGTGAHDAQPHEHLASPYGGYRSFSLGPYGVTESDYSPVPYRYVPW